MIKEFLPTNLNLISVNAIGLLSDAVLLLFAVVSGIVIFHLLRVERKSNALVPVKLSRKEIRVIRRPRGGRR